MQCPPIDRVTEDGSDVAVNAELQRTTMGLVDEERLREPGGEEGDDLVNPGLGDGHFKFPRSRLLGIGFATVASMSVR